MKYPKDVELKMIQFLRFRRCGPAKCSRTFMPLNAIAKYLNKSAAYVHHKCQKLIRDERGNDLRRKESGLGKSRFSQYLFKNRKEFSQEQISYLTKQTTLIEWATKSLPQRLALFKRRYPDSLVTVYKLRKLYQ